MAINGTAVFLALPALTSERGCSLQSIRISKALIIPSAWVRQSDGPYGHPCVSLLFCGSSIYC